MPLMTGRRHRLPARRNSPARRCRTSCQSLLAAAGAGPARARSPCPSRWDFLAISFEHTRPRTALPSRRSRRAREPRGARAPPSGGLPEGLANRRLIAASRPRCPAEAPAVRSHRRTPLQRFPRRRSQPPPCPTPWPPAGHSNIPPGATDARRDLPLRAGRACPFARRGTARSGGCSKSPSAVPSRVRRTPPPTSITTAEGNRRRRSRQARRRNSWPL